MYWKHSNFYCSSENYLLCLLQFLLVHMVFMASFLRRETYMQRMGVVQVPFWEVPKCIPNVYPLFWIWIRVLFNYLNKKKTESSWSYYMLLERIKRTSLLLLSYRPGDLSQQPVLYVSVSSDRRDPHILDTPRNIPRGLWY